MERGGEKRNLDGVDTARCAVRATQASRVGAVANLLVHVEVLGEWFVLHALDL